MFASVTSANAAYYCSVDPNIPLGTPINYSLNTDVNIGTINLNTQNSGNSHYQHFAAGFGL